jgi:hypothetical protein
MATYISPQVAAYYGVQPGQTVDNSITNTSSSSGGGGFTPAQDTTKTNTTETVPGGVIVRDANGNIISDTRAIINQTSKAQTEAQLTGTNTPAQQIQATQSQQNIQAANQLLPTLYAQKEGRAPLAPGQTYQDVLRSIRTLEGARQAESQYSGVSSSYGYDPRATNQYYEARAAETARVNPVLAQQYGEGTVYMGATPTFKGYEQPVTGWKPPPTLADIRSEAGKSDLAYISNATGANAGLGYYINVREGAEPIGKLGKASYSATAEKLIGKSMQRERNIIYEYTANLNEGLSQEEFKAAKAGLNPSNANTLSDFTGYTKKNVGTITVVAKEGNKEVGRNTQPYDIYVKEVPAPPQETQTFSMPHRNPNNKYTQIDEIVYMGGAISEDVQSGLENFNINGVKPIGGIINLSTTASKSMASYADTQAYNPYLPYWANPVWVSAELVSGALALPAAIGKLPEITGKTLSAGWGLQQYTNNYISDVLTGRISEVPTDQAQDIGERARGSLTQYYAQGTNPTFYAQTAGMVALPFVAKAGYGLLKDTTGVIEPGRYVLADRTIKELPTYTWNRESPIATKPVETSPGSGYTGLFYTRGTVSKPLIGSAEGKIVIGEPTFTVAPERVFNSEIRADPMATAIAEKATQDYANRMGMPEQAEGYQAYRYAARETYPLQFQPKQSLESVLSQQPDNYGAVVYEFIKQDKDITGVKLSEPKGSAAQRVFMGEEMNRLPADVDIRRVNAAEGASKLYNSQATKQFLQETGIKARLDTEANRIEFYNPKTNEWYHRVEFKEKTGEPSLEGTPGYFNQPEYIGYGLKEKAYQDIGGGIRISQLGEQGARKASSAFTPRETGEFLPEPHRLKDISDATNIFRFVSEEKNRPDIYAGIVKAIPKLTAEQQKAAKALLPETPTLEYAISRKLPATFTETATKAGTATAEANYKNAEVRTQAKYGDMLAKDYGSAKPYGTSSYRSAPYTTPSYTSTSYKAPPSPSGYRAASPKPSVSMPAYKTPEYKAPEYNAPPSPASYTTPSPSYAPKAPNYKAPSPSNYKTPAPYRAPYKAPPYRSTPRITTNTPPPPKTLTFPGRQVGGEQVRNMEAKPETTGIEGGKHSLLADLLSVEISRARYGVATSVNPKSNKGIWQYEANAFGYVPTAQLIKGGGNMGRNPMPARVLIPTRKGGKK